MLLLLDYKRILAGIFGKGFGHIQCALRNLCLKKGFFSGQYFQHLPPNSKDSCTTLKCIYFLALFYNNKNCSPHIEQFLLFGGILQIYRHKVDYSHLLFGGIFVKYRQKVEIAQCGVSTSIFWRYSS